MTLLQDRPARQTSEPFDALFGVISCRRDISPAAKVVYAKLVTLHRTARSLTQREIGAETGLSRHQVWSALQELVRARLLLVTRVGLGLPNQYTLLGVPVADLDGRSTFRKVRNQHAGQSGSSTRNDWQPKKNEKNDGYRMTSSYGQGRLGTVPAR